jgi:hypothetical protein
MSAIRKQWFFVIQIKKEPKSRFQWRHTSNLENYGDAVTEMVDEVLEKFGEGFEFEFINTVVRYE